MLIRNFLLPLLFLLIDETVDGFAVVVVVVDITTISLQKLGPPSEISEKSFLN